MEDNMMLNDELREFAKRECGGAQIGIAPADDLSPEEMANIRRTNEILAQHNPHFLADAPIFHPKDFLDNPTCVVVIGYNFFFGHKPELPGDPARTSFMNFYVNPDVLDHVVEKGDLVVKFLREKGYQASTTANGLPVKLITSKSSVGSYGKNGVIHNRKMGSWIGLSLIVTDAPFEIDTPAKDYCKKCNLCVEACPTGALDTPYTCDISKCITLHMVYNKGDIPHDLRGSSGPIVAQCDICLDSCPHNKKLKVQEDISADREILYPELSSILHMDDKEYERVFGDSFLEFMIADKKFLKRNSAIALGNCKDQKYVPDLAKALLEDPDELVRAGAAWALGKIGTTQAIAVLKDALALDSSLKVKKEIETALSR